MPTRRGYKPKDRIPLRGRLGSLAPPRSRIHGFIVAVGKACHVGRKFDGHVSADLFRLDRDLYIDPARSVGDSHSVEVNEAHAVAVYRDAQFLDPAECGKGLYDASKTLYALQERTSPSAGREMLPSETMKVPSRPG